MIIARKNGALIAAKVLRESEKSTLCAVYDGKHIRVRKDDPKQKLFDDVDAALKWIGVEL